MAILIPFERNYTQNVHLKKKTKKQKPPVVVKCAEKNCLDPFHTSSSAQVGQSTNLGHWGFV